MEQLTQTNESVANPLGNSMTRRRGFSLIELLVSISIIALLIAILLPAVQQAREAARRTICRNNLRQIGIALHNYHDAHQCLPPGWIPFDSRASRPADRAGSWAWTTFLLPYIDQKPLYETLGVASVQDPPSPGATNDKLLPLMICPSDNGAEESGCGLWFFGDITNPDKLLAGYKKSNYIGNYGINDTYFMEFPPPRAPAFKGIFDGGSRTRFASIVDGASNTFCIGERIGRPSNQRYFCGTATLWIRNCLRLRDPSSTSLHGNCRDSGTVGVETSLAAVTGVTRTVIIGAPDGALITFAKPEPMNEFHADQQVGFSSKHTSGATFLMADGSVRFVNQSIDAETYANLSTIEGGEVIGDF